MISPPKLNLGQSRLTLKDKSPGSYEILSSRANGEDRSRIKYLVKVLETHTNFEDFFEDTAYRFFIEKPYVRGYNFLFPVNPIAQIRKTNLAIRTGWRQINFPLNHSLATAIREEVTRLQKYNKSISVVSYLYTALRWYLDKLEQTTPKKVHNIEEASAESKPPKKAKKHEKIASAQETPSGDMAPAAKETKKKVSPARKKQLQHKRQRKGVLNDGRHYDQSNNTSA